LKTITVHVPGRSDLKNKEFLLEKDDLTMEEFLLQYLGKTPDDLDRIFISGDGLVDYIIFINGTICRDRDYVLQNNDKMLISVMMGGG